ncbi:MAG: hypothetical protein AAF799_20775 [Myxococcota bacterium]
MFASLVERVYAGVASEVEVGDAGRPLVALLMRYCQRVVAHPNLAAYVLSDLSLMSDELTTLTERVRVQLRERGVPEAELETALGVIIDYTHGFAFSAGASRPSPLSLDHFERGLGWLLDR